MNAEIPSFIAALCAGVFFGVAVCVSVVQQPAALAAGGSVAGRLFAPMYRRAAPVQASLAIIGSLAAVAGWFLGAGVVWLVGGLLLVSVVPFTLLCVKPVNDVLMAAGRDPGSPETTELLHRWSRLHMVRTVLSGLAFVLFLVGPYQ